ncbi:hypothetical protein RDI58_017678 [Solanum bulbocastanum]|uniref:DUF4283 domain-containing protein n=1 Tax=Solanum bulbocastanum TaxID=147425 RepID=A0AAN8Y929_SOLBU
MSKCGIGSRFTYTISSSVQISVDSIVPIVRSQIENSSKMANEAPQLCTQVRIDSELGKVDSYTGNFFPHLDEHLTRISSNLDRPITIEVNFGGAIKVEVGSKYNKEISQINTGLDEGLEGRNRSSPMMNNNLMTKGFDQHRERMNVKNKGKKHQEPNRAGEQGNNKLMTQNKDGKQRDNEEQQQGTDHKQQRKVKPSGNSLNPSSSQFVNAKTNFHLQPHANEQDRNIENQLMQDSVHNTKEPHEHGKQDKRQAIIPMLRKTVLLPIPNFPKSPNHKNNSNKEQIPVPAPFIVIQTFAAKLRQNQNQKVDSLNHVAHGFTIRQGLPAVIFKRDDFNHKLVTDYKFTLIGKFSNTMPKIELIRKNFILQTQLSGGVKISHFNSKDVYIDLDNDPDYITVGTKQKMTTERQLMRIQNWTPTFRPEQETSIVLVWIALPKLPWHCYKKEFVSIILELIGKVLYLDSPTAQKTRGSAARVKDQVQSHPGKTFSCLDGH